MTWQPYDPTWLVDRARDQRPDLPWLPEAFAACTRAAMKNPQTRRHGRCVQGCIYIYFVSPDGADRPGAQWQYDSGLWLKDPIHGNLLADVLKNKRIGGIEFYDRLFDNPVAGRGD